MSTRPSSPADAGDGDALPAPAEPGAASGRRPRCVLPTLLMLAVLALLGGVALRRVGPRPVPPPAVPVYTPQQAAQAEEHLDALREQLDRPALPADTAPAVSPAGQTIAPAQPSSPVPPQDAPAPRPVHLELSQNDLNTYLATNQTAKTMLARDGVKAVQILFREPQDVTVRAAVLYRGRPANVQITGNLQPSPKTLLRLVATGAQIGRLPLPPAAITKQADRLARQLVRRFHGHPPLTVQSVHVEGDRLVVAGVAASPTPSGVPTPSR